MKSLAQEVLDSLEKPSILNEVLTGQIEQYIEKLNKDYTDMRKKIKSLNDPIITKKLEDVSKTFNYFFSALMDLHDEVELFQNKNK